MNVASVNGGASLQPLQKAPEASEGAAKGPDGDGDTDDRGSAATAAPTSVNLAGQQLGRLINVRA